MSFEKFINNYVTNRLKFPPHDNYKDLVFSHTDMQNSYEAGRAEERKRCAEIALRYDDDKQYPNGTTVTYGDTIVKRIAKAIEEE